MTKWNRFIHQYLKDVKLWLFFVLYLAFFRLVFIFYFRDKIDEASSWRDVLSAALTGLRYDSKAAALLVLATFLLSVVTGLADVERIADRFRRIYGSVVILVSTLACVVTIGFFQEYNDQFNHFLFNLYYDDTRAIFSTIWAAYHPVLVLTVIVAVSFGMTKIKNRFFDNSFISKNILAAYTPALPYRIVITVALVFLLASAARGSFGHRPLKLHDATVSKDDFLNKAVMNPYFALLKAFGNRATLSAGAGIESFLPDRDVRKAAQRVFSRGESFDNLDSYMLKHARGPKSRPPRHVVLILMESYDAWPLLEKYDSLGLTNNLKRLARDGLYIQNFLPAGTWTVPAFCTLLTNLPDTTVPVNYQDASRAGYPSAIAATFKRLGYTTRLFYGGFLSWERIGDFSRAQGFEEVYGALHIKDRASMKSWGHEWGVEDEDLFNFVLGKVEDNEPSFNLILTTTNHLPYRLDVKAKGFPLEKIPDDVAPMFDGRVGLHILGHLWYQDRSVGEFVRKAEKKLPRALFALTGDHYGRRYINAKPQYFEKSAVPFVLYGKDVLKGITLPEGVAGSHIDIGPTLVELAAPKGFPYYSVGKDLLKPRKDFIGIGWGNAIGADYIFELETSKMHPLPGKELPEKLPDVNELRSLLNNYYGIGWWRVKRGPQL